MGVSGWERHRLVLLATGVASEPRGAWFEPVHADGLVEVARAGGLHLVEVDAAELRALDPDLPAGHLLGPAQTTPLPPMQRATFDRLIALPGICAAPRQVARKAAVPASAPPAPRFLHVSRRTLRVGSIVLASVDAGDGWWEAEVVAFAPGEVL